GGGGAGVLEAAGLGRLVEAGRPAEPDVPLEGSCSLLHGERHQPDRAAVQVGDLGGMRECSRSTSAGTAQSLVWQRLPGICYKQTQIFSTGGIPPRWQKQSASTSARPTRAWPCSRAASPPSSRTPKAAGRPRPSS